MRWLDTNVICNFLTDLDTELQSRATQILLNGEIHFVADIVLLETAYVLSIPFRLPHNQVIDTLLDFLRQPFIRVQNPEEVLKALLLWRDHPQFDFADCLLVSRAAGADAEGLVSFDKHFSELPCNLIIP